MKYLLYFEDGFIRKFPLHKKIFSIGRAPENDLVIKEECVSRRHVQATVGEDHIHIIDLNSKNGIYVKGGRVHEARIALNESFLLKNCEFYLKDGDLTEFKAAPELIPVFKQIDRRAEQRVKDIETRYIQDASLEVLKQLLVDGLKCQGLNEFLLSLSNYLSVFNQFGNLLLVCRDQQKTVYSYRHEDKEEKILKIIRQDPDFYASSRSFAEIATRAGEHYCSYPLLLRDSEALLLYLTPAGTERLPKKLDKFLQILAVEIELVAQLASLDGCKVNGAGKEITVNDTITTVSPEVKRLIQESRMIANSELSILIQGESGTGKELFARLIHAHSPRRAKPLIAINCAAIPENLLESEFFGHERGAFTGAHALKKGKLELSSGGILILDEIGEMPISLQVKLLRALEEKEFFRVGGLTPIRVDLRIISLTNSRLLELIQLNKFRSDLYYRLVHHTMNLPPLRDRSEDIPLLINHFTLHFARQYNQKVKGYSTHAFRALKEYSWPGNIRQLKNEVHRLVNLAGDSGLIDYDLLSENIRHPLSAADRTAEFAALAGHGEDEQQQILRLLKKNHNNKSRTARELNITYQGLHKKMKRLGIDKDAKSDPPLSPIADKKTAPE